MYVTCFFLPSYQHRLHQIGHCKFLQPIFEELATELKDQVAVGKVDIDVNKQVAARFQITSYPTVKFFSKGNMLTFKYEGGRSKEDMLNFIRDGNSNNMPTEPVPKDFTARDLLERWLSKQKGFAHKRLMLAKRDVAAVSHCSYRYFFLCFVCNCHITYMICFSIYTSIYT